MSSKYLILPFSILLTLFHYFDSGTIVSITLSVNMSHQIVQGKFNPITEYVDVAGTFNNWGNPLVRLTDLDGDRIYTVTLSGFTPGETIEFKFRINGQWDGREEFPFGGNNRRYTVSAETNELYFWYNNEAPPGIVTADIEASEESIYSGGVVTFSNRSSQNINQWSWFFEGGYPPRSAFSTPKVRYTTPGSYDVTLIVRGTERSDTLHLEDFIHVQERPDDQAPWWNRLVFYEIFIRSFYDSDNDGIGDLKGLIQKLDYLNDGDPDTGHDLGITGIWLMPVHRSASYHGYDVTDYRSIHEDFGTLEDFRMLIDEAHSRGIKVIIDFVMNHTSSSHPWFLESASDSESPMRNWYRWTDTHPGYTGPWGQPVWHSHPSGFYYGLFWSGMPDLNYAEPAVEDSLFAIADYWLGEMNVDGFRLDAVRYIFEEGNELEETDATLNFWKDFRTHFKQTHPQAFAVGEAYTNTNTVLQYVEDGRLDFCFDFDLASAILREVNSGTGYNLTAQIQKAYNIFPHLQFGTFLTNHDQNRVMTVFNENPSKAKVAASIYLTLPGIPFIYYGEEIGMAGDKPDEFIRRPMQWDNGPYGGFSNSVPWEPLNDNYIQFNVSDQISDDQSILSWYRKLIKIRQAEPALQLGAFKQIGTNSLSLLAYIREYLGERLLIVINTGAQDHTDITLDITFGDLDYGSYQFIDLIDTTLGAMEVMLLDDLSIKGIPLEGGGTRIFKIVQSTDTRQGHLNNNIRLYPNPVSDEVFIEIDRPANRIRITLFDIHGRQVIKQDYENDQGLYKLVMTNLPKGLYALNLAGPGFERNFKLLKW